MMLDYPTISLTHRVAFENARAMMRMGQSEDAIPDDRPELTGAEAAVFAQSALSPIASLRGPIGVAVFLIPDFMPKVLWLDILYVTPAFRRRGIGRCLLNRVRSVAAAHRLPLAFGTLETNTSMQAFAAATGCKILDRHGVVVQYLGSAK